MGMEYFNKSRKIMDQLEASEQKHIHGTSGVRIVRL